MHANVCFFFYVLIFNDTYTSLDSQIRMLSNDLKYVNLANEIEVYMT